LAKVLRRMTHKLAALAWGTWRQRASKQRQLTNVASKGVRKIFNRTMALALGRWRVFTVELQRQRRVCLNFYQSFHFSMFTNFSLLPITSVPLFFVELACFLWKGFETVLGRCWPRCSIA
jgi:hypothetical protein